MRGLVVTLACVASLGPGSAMAEGLTDAEMQSFRLQIAQCWNVSALDDEAANAVITVGFALDEDARPVGDSLELVDQNDAPEAAVRSAYVSARRAILRCGARGFKLPLEKRAAWRNIRVTFNPERMRLR